MRPSDAFLSCARGEMRKQGGRPSLREELPNAVGGASLALGYYASACVGAHYRLLYIGKPEKDIIFWQRKLERNT